MSVKTHGPLNKPVEDWSGCDDAELRTRLMHRGVDPLRAKELVHARELAAESEEITSHLAPGGDYDQAAAREAKAMKEVSQGIIDQS
jgi:hypothetical protein